MEVTRLNLGPAGKAISQSDMCAQNDGRATADDMVGVAGAESSDGQSQIGMKKR